MRRAVLSHNRLLNFTGFFSNLTGAPPAIVASMLSRTCYNNPDQGNRVASLLVKLRRQASVRGQDRDQNPEDGPIKQINRENWGFRWRINSGRRSVGKMNDSNEKE